MFTPKFFWETSRLGPRKIIRILLIVQEFPSPTSITMQGFSLCWKVTSPPFSLGSRTRLGFVMSNYSSYRSDAILIIVLLVAFCSAYTIDSWIPSMVVCPSLSTMSFVRYFEFAFGWVESMVMGLLDLRLLPEVL